MGDNAETISISDLAEGDVVRIGLDDDGALKTLIKMEAPTAPTNPAASDSISDAAATGS